MDHLSNSTDYDVFIANMNNVVVNSASVEMFPSGPDVTCSNCIGCKFNDTLLYCEYKEDYDSETYHKLLHYISIHHPEKLV